jgi:two-component system response regulator
MSDLDDIEVLLVEDNQHDAEMTMRALRKGNFLNKLHWVKDGVEALDFIRCSDTYASRTPTERLKVVLLDLKMPRLSGIEVLRELKSDPRTHDIPIVVMSSSSQERDVVESYKLGANGFVTKPINVSNFMEAVAQIGMYWLLVNQSTAQ